MPNTSPTGNPYPEKSQLDQLVGGFGQTVADVMKGLTGSDPAQTLGRFKNPLSTLGPDRFPPFTTPQRGPVPTDLDQLSLDQPSQPFTPQGPAQNFGNTLRDAVGTASLAAPSGVPARQPRWDQSRINQLAKQAQGGDRAALDELVQSMTGVIKSLSGRYARPVREGFITGEPGLKTIEPQVQREDLFNTGMEKMLSSLGGYKEGAKGFMGYVYPNVVKGVRSEALKGASPIAISPEILQAMRKLDAAEGRLRVQHGPYAEFSLDQLASAARLKPDMVARIKSGQIQSAPRAQSLDELMARQRDPGGYESSLDKALMNPDPGMEQYTSQTEQPGARLIKSNKSNILGDVYKDLPSNMKAYIEASEAAKTPADAAAKMGVSRATYFRNLAKAKETLSQNAQAAQAKATAAENVPAEGTSKPISGGGPAKADYAHYQEGYGDLPGFHNYNLTEPFTDAQGVVHPAGTTKSEAFLKASGIPYDQPSTGLTQGSQVRLLHDPDRTGVLTGQTTQRNGLTYHQMKEPHAGSTGYIHSWVPEDQLLPSGVKPISGSSSGPIPPTGKKGANFEQLTRILDQTAGKLRQPNIPEPDPNIIRQLGQATTQQNTQDLEGRSFGTQPGWSTDQPTLNRMGTNMLKSKAGMTRTTEKTPDLWTDTDRPAMSLQNEIYPEDLAPVGIRPPTPGVQIIPGERRLPPISGGSGDVWSNPVWSDLARRVGLQQPVSNPPYQRRMLGQSNERVDRLNQSNQRWGMPAIQQESSQAQLTPRAYNAPVGVNAPSSGMGNLKDAATAAHVRQQILDILSGGGGDADFWTLQDKGLTGHGTPKSNKGRGSVLPNNPSETKDIYGNTH